MYNKYMGSVDRSDQLLRYYPFEIKTLSWYAKVGMHIFHVITNNAFILYKQQTENKSTRIIDFRDSVIKKLIFSNRPNIITLPQPQKQILYVAPKVPLNEKNRPIRKICAICSKNKKRIETCYFKINITIF